MKVQELNTYHILPVHIISAYNYILRDTGSLYHTNIKSDLSEMFSGIFVYGGAVEEASKDRV